ncbi:MAG TPA: hypothetical protein DCP90_05705 [Clostridiales bacterium]|nr:MAG: hypothetical protein A2Y22_04970 [Clostridiales bacterium GWD2_32_59]HAN10096.1 hypothetical protein [Clostridiales bacterium]
MEKEIMREERYEKAESTVKVSRADEFISMDGYQETYDIYEHITRLMSARGHDIDISKGGGNKTEEHNIYKHITSVMGKQEYEMIQ